MKNFRGWLALLLVFSMVAGVGLHQFGNSLRASEAAEPAVSEEPAEEAVTMEPTEDKSVKTDEVIVSETQIETTTQTQESAPAESQEVAKVSEPEKAEYTINIKEPEKDGGSVFVWSDGSKKQISFSNGIYKEKVKEDAAFNLQIETRDGYKVEKVERQDGSVLEPVFVENSTYSYRIDSISSDDQVKITYKEAKEEVEEAAKEDSDKEESKDETRTEDTEAGKGGDKPSQTLKAVASGTVITVTALAGALPEGATVKAVKVNSLAVENSIENAVKDEGHKLVDYEAYDITIYDKDGKKIQPDDSVKVAISGSDVKGEEKAIYHIDSNGVEKVDGTTSGKTAVFSAEQFSIYVVGGVESVDPEGDTATVRINYTYENGTVAADSYTFSVEKDEDGTYTVSYDIPSKEGYTPILESENPNFKINGNKLEGTFESQEQQVVYIVYQAETVDYTVKHLYEDPNGQYVEDASKQETKQGAVGSLTEAAEILTEGFTVQEIDQAEIQKEGIVVEVKYDRNEYTLTYVTNGGSYVPSVSGKYEETITLASGKDEPTRKGYTFKGWYTDEDCETSAGDTVKLTDNTKVYAKWDGAIVKYKIIYLTENADDDGYSYAGTVELEAKAGTEVTADKGTRKPSGFDTEHFAFESATTETVNADGSTVITVKYNRNEYTITFVGTAECGKNEHTHTFICGYWAGWCEKEEHVHNNECYITIVAKYQANIKDKWNEAVGPGTKYAGSMWLWDKNPKVYTGFQSTMPGENKMVIADGEGNVEKHLFYYVEDENGDVTYSKNGEQKKFQLYTEVILHVGAFSVPTYNEEFFVIDGYERFASNIPNWENGEENGAGRWTDGGGKFYYSKKCYKLELVNGDQTTTIQVPYLDNISQYLGAPEYNPLGDGIFDGWYLDPGFRQKYDGDNKMPKSLVLYAKWNPVTYEVTFKDSESGVIYETQTVERNGTVVVKNSPEKAGYVFKGWYMDKDCTKAFDYATQITENTIVYAKWQENKTTSYTVKYVTADGKEVAEPQTFSGKAGATVQANAIVAKGEFEGYAVDKISQTIKLDPNAEKNVITFTYTKAGELKYTVQYVCGDEVIYTTDLKTSKVNHIKIIADQEELLKLGYKVKQIYQWVELTTGENIVTFECDKAKYNITYKNVDGATWGESGSTNPNPSEYTIDDGEIILVSPEKENETFIGWDFTSQDGKVITNDHNPTNTVVEVGAEKSHGDLEFTARWARLTATGWNEVYDGQTHAVSAEVTGAEGYTIYYKIDGGEWSTEVPSIKDVGEKVVHVKAEKQGYCTLTANAVLKVTPRAVTVNADPAEKQFGESDPIFTATVNGTLNDDKINYTVTRPNAGNEETVGTYENAIVASGDENQGNYKVTYKPATFKINPITEAGAFTVSLTGASYTYDGTPHSLTEAAIASVESGTTYQYTAKENPQEGDWVDSIDEITRTNVGTTTVSVKAANPNYVNAATASAELVITKREITITVDSASKIFEGNDPDFTGNISGNIEGDDIGTITYIRTNDDENVGTYEDVLSAEVTNPNSNYTYTVVPADFTITKADSNIARITSAAEDLAKFYDGNSVSINAEADKAGSTLLYSTDGKEWSQDNPGFVNAGTYNVYVKATNDNFEDTPVVSAMIVINPRTVVISSGNASKTFDGSALTSDRITVSEYNAETGEGFIEGEGADYNITGSQIEVGSSDNTFEYTLKEGTLAKNYSIVVKPGTLTVVAVSDTPIVTPGGNDAPPVTPATVIRTLPGAPPAVANLIGGALQNEGTRGNELVVSEDDGVPLANMKGEHRCCIFHFLLMLIALILLALYTRYMKKRQEELFELRRKIDGYVNNQGSLRRR